MIWEIKMCSLCICPGRSFVVLNFVLKVYRCTTVTELAMHELNNKLLTMKNWFNKSVSNIWQVDHWINFASGRLSCSSDFKAALEYLDQVLGPITVLVGNDFTIADFAIWETLHGERIWYIPPFPNLDNVISFRDMRKCEQNFQSFFLEIIFLDINRSRCGIIWKT